MTNTYAYDLATPSTPFGEDTTEVVGTRSGTQVPKQVCSIINFGVNRRYRGSKPKIWLPFGVDADITSPTQWTSTFASALTSGWEAYVGALNGEASGSTTLGAQVAVSYFSGKEKNPNPNGRLQYVPTLRTTPLVMQVVSVGGNQTLGSQRRRIRGL